MRGGNSITAIPSPRTSCHLHNLYLRSSFRCFVISTPRLPNSGRDGYGKPGHFWRAANGLRHSTPCKLLPVDARQNSGSSRRDCAFLDSPRVPTRSRTAAEIFKSGAPSRPAFYLWSRIPPPQHINHHRKQHVHVNLRHNWRHHQTPSQVQTFVCDRFQVSIDDGDDEWLLRADLTIACNSSSRRKMALTFAWLMFMVFPLGLFDVHVRTTLVCVVCVHLSDLSTVLFRCAASTLSPVVPSPIRSQTYWRCDEHS